MSVLVHRARAADPSGRFFHSPFGAALADFIPLDKTADPAQAAAAAGRLAFDALANLMDSPGGFRPLSLSGDAALGVYDADARDLAVVLAVPNAIRAYIRFRLARNGQSLPGAWPDAADAASVPPAAGAVRQALALDPGDNAKPDPQDPWPRPARWWITEQDGLLLAATSPERLARFATDATAGTGDALRPRHAAPADPEITLACGPGGGEPGGRRTIGGGAAEAAGGGRAIFAPVLAPVASLPPSGPSPTPALDGRASGAITPPGRLQAAAQALLDGARLREAVIRISFAGNAENAGNADGRLVYDAFFTGGEMADSPFAPREGEEGAESRTPAPPDGTEAAEQLVAQWQCRPGELRERIAALFWGEAKRPNPARDHPDLAALWNWLDAGVLRHGDGRHAFCVMPLPATPDSGGGVAEPNLAALPWRFPALHYAWGTDNAAATAEDFTRGARHWAEMQAAPGGPPLARLFRDGVAVEAMSIPFRGGNPSAHLLRLPALPCGGLQPAWMVWPAGRSPGNGGGFGVLATPAAALALALANPPLPWPEAVESAELSETRPASTPRLDLRWRWRGGPGLAEALGETAEEIIVRRGLRPRDWTMKDAARFAALWRGFWTASPRGEGRLTILDSQAEPALRQARLRGWIDWRYTEKP